MSNAENYKQKSEDYSLLTIFSQEKARIVSKGFGGFIGLGIALSFFCVLPKLIQFMILFIPIS